MASLNGAAITEVIFAILALGFVATLTGFVFKLREVQPMKIKSPKLLILFLIGNMAAIVFITLIAVDAEVQKEAAAGCGPLADCTV